MDILEGSVPFAHIVRSSEIAEASSRIKVRIDWSDRRSAWDDARSIKLSLRAVFRQLFGEKPLELRVCSLLVRLQEACMCFLTVRDAKVFTIQNLLSEVKLTPLALNFGVSEVPGVSASGAKAVVWFVVCHSLIIQKKKALTGALCQSVNWLSLPER